MFTNLACSWDEPEHYRTQFSRNRTAPSDYQQMHYLSGSPAKQHWKIYIFGGFTHSLIMRHEIEMICATLCYTSEQYLQFSKQYHGNIDHVKASPFCSSDREKSFSEIDYIQCLKKYRFSSFTGIIHSLPDQNCCNFDYFDLNSILFHNIQQYYQNTGLSLLSLYVSSSMETKSVLCTVCFPGRRFSK